jgi:hypothetical protein
VGKPDDHVPHGGGRGTSTFRGRPFCETTIASASVSGKAVTGHIRHLRDVLAAAEADAVTAARQAGTSWGAIGASLGITKQAALKRFGNRREPKTSEPTINQEVPARPAGEKSRTVKTSWDLTTPGGRTLLRLRPSSTTPDRRAD